MLMLLPPKHYDIDSSLPATRTLAMAPIRMSASAATVTPCRRGRVARALAKVAGASLEQTAPAVSAQPRSRLLSPGASCAPPAAVLASVPRILLSPSAEIAPFSRAPCQPPWPAKTTREMRWLPP
jgi:hypothetical protein